MELRGEWAGFDLLTVGGEKLMVHRRGNLVMVSGCITTVSPMKQKANFDLNIGQVPHYCNPQRYIPFVAPTAMSRYEGIKQCGTSSILRDDGKLMINFNKNTNPMVLHFSGLIFNVQGEPEEEIEIAHRDRPKPGKEVKDVLGKGKGKGKDEDMSPTRRQELRASQQDPPGLQRENGIVTLQGSLLEATYGFSNLLVGYLPEGYRPKREIRCLAPLIHMPKQDDFACCPIADQTIALTVKPDGNIFVQGGNQHAVDQKGLMRVLPQRKRGILSFDGIRFSQANQGLPITLAAGLGSKKSSSKLLQKLGSSDSSAIALKHGDLVLLEGGLDWTNSKTLNNKQVIARLPEGCWPRRREIFFTRGRDEERRRVDIDMWGRIFCPEGDDKTSDGGHVELSGIAFMAAAEPPLLQPLEPEFDDLKLLYNRTVVDVAAGSFKGHELLEQFIRRCSHYEWNLLKYNMARHAGRSMLTPLGDAPLRGWERGNEYNLDKDCHRLWRDVLKHKLDEHWGITTWHTLMHLSDAMLDKVLECCSQQLGDRDRKLLKKSKRICEGDWERKRHPGLNFNRLGEIAADIVDHMFEHWDFSAQLQGLMKNDFRAPETIKHLFPRHVAKWQEKLIKDNIAEKEMGKFEEIRQFFFLYETTGSNMTHCSLMGSSDLFTTTGKWYFPDAPDVQRQLFENVAWLYDRNIHHYISERQTPTFPFIEDFDIQAAKDYRPIPPGREWADPPDDLFVTMPIRHGPEPFDVGGDPGFVLKHRATAIHMMYPHIEELYCLVYSASGYNKGKEMVKSSFHLVWPQIVVDPSRAQAIRYVTLGIFKNETNKQGSDIQLLQEKLMEMDRSNEWELVFDSTTINARNGLRLPYSDKASMVVKDPEDKARIARGELSKNSAFKIRVVEERPSKAVGRINFSFVKDEDGEERIQARWVQDEKSQERSEWIRMGSCRLDQADAISTKMTPWQLGPEVMGLLPKKPGEKYYRESEDDQGIFRTHVSYPNILRCALSVDEFVAKFDEQLGEEMDALLGEGEFDLRKRIAGQWITVTEDQAMWRAPAARQFSHKFPDWHWGSRSKQLLRPAELTFLKSVGKVIVDGPDDVRTALVRVLKLCRTEMDDNPIMPVFDTEMMHSFP
ncbi:unnamed protein product [Symbiodinium pilosum]|uniref:C962R-like N-terminal AEP domain-containing protein n=1 Tax=Symbiodinium pilosum TaxID=2952 RepID=A0A812TYZ7_SYMPI|nr:unnamed protein product [Symbiodinium pilosum]